MPASAADKITTADAGPVALADQLLPCTGSENSFTLEISGFSGQTPTAQEGPHHYAIRIATSQSNVPIAPRLILDLADGTQSIVYLGFGHGSAFRCVFARPSQAIRAKLQLALWQSNREILRADMWQIGRFEMKSRQFSALAKLSLKPESWRRAAQALGLGAANGLRPLQALREIAKLLRPGSRDALTKNPAGDLMPRAYWFREYEILMQQAAAAPAFSEYDKACDAAFGLFAEPGATPTAYAKALLGKAAAQCDCDIIYGDSLIYGDSFSQSATADGTNNEATEPTIETRFPFSPEYFSTTPDLGGVIALSQDLIAAMGVTDYAAATAQIPQWIEDGRTICYLPAILSKQTVTAYQDSKAGSQALQIPTPAALSAAPMSVVIPTMNAHQHLKACLQSLNAFEARDDLEVIIVQNNTSDPDALAFLTALPPHIKRIVYAGKFNYAGIMNFGTRAATQKPFLVHLNDDTELLTPDALIRLCHRANYPDVGAVGPKLLFSNDLIQHAGMEFGDNGTCHMIGILEPSVIEGRDNTGYRQAFGSVRQVSAVTGACIAMRRQVFEEVGGYDEALAVTYNDVDLCLRIAARGYRVIFDGTVRIRHHASVSRGRTLVDPFPTEAAHFRAKHASLLAKKDRFAPGLGRLAGSGMRLETPFDAAQISLTAAPACYRPAGRNKRQPSDPEYDAAAIARKNYKE